MPINRLLKDKRTPEEIELLNKAHFAIWLLARLSRSARQALTNRERLRKWPWPGLAHGKAPPQMPAPLASRAGCIWNRNIFYPE